MGKNSKQRRDARRRREPKAQPRGPQGPSTAGASRSGPDAGFNIDPGAVLDLAVSSTFRRLSRRRLEDDLTEQAEVLVRRAAPLPASAVRRRVATLLEQVVSGAVTSGWCPDDLVELVRRQGVPGDLSLLAHHLGADARTGQVSRPWRDQLDRLSALAPGDGPDGDVAAIAAALHLALLLHAQPSLPVATARVGSGRPERAAAAVEGELARKLATVRGLLAKAESTTFDDEADALSAKAQELISRYALQRLLDGAVPGDESATAAPGVRRIWLDAPYVGAKAQLVHQVALANRCRAVLSDPPGVSTVVGDSSDLVAVELLVTSLLVQGNGSMLRHGRAVDARGASRTRSFRQSFLTSFAIRIGQRLRETFDEVLAESGESAGLLPVLRSREQAVTEAFEALVPRTTTTTTSVSNAAGWTAGQVAADLALIDVQGRIVAPSEESDAG